MQLRGESYMFQFDNDGLPIAIYRRLNSRSAVERFLLFREKRSQSLADFG